MGNVAGLEREVAVWATPGDEESLDRIGASCAVAAEPAEFARVLD